MSKKIGSQQVAFFRYELEQGNATRKKGALQDLCALYRRGYFLPAEAVDVFETLINGLVLQDNQDLKVVRWCLNALAQFGRLGNSHHYVEGALLKYAGDPEIEAAGVAALCHMYRGCVDDIEALRAIDPITWKLAALQNTDPKKIALDGIKINIDRAEAPILRLALITVGLNRDIENLFHPKHSNSIFVRRLCQHPDDVVQQYSVWAVIENRRLVFDDLGISLDSIENLRPNVQSKLYQLVAERDPDLRRRRSITELGSNAAPDIAREGLAKGVKNHYYDGLEDVTIDWFGQERNGLVRGHLAEHFSRFADQCPPYETIVMRTYEAEQQLQERLLLGAEGKALYGKLKAIEANDLLSGIGNHFDIGRALRDRLSSEVTLPRRKVQMFAANPLDTGRLRLDEEQREIANRVKLLDATKVELQFVVHPAARTSDILPSILGSDAEVFYFSGHGEIGALVFENDRGQRKRVDGATLADLLKKGSRTLKCLVLNACYSDRLAANLAPHVEIMVGCNATIDDAAAITFATAFFSAMASGKSYADCSELAVNDVKLSHSRREAAKYIIRRRE